jgi:uncharacterized protein YaaN involved in tellurite resistance
MTNIWETLKKSKNDIIFAWDDVVDGITELEQERDAKISNLESERDELIHKLKQYEQPANGQHSI